MKQPTYGIKQTIRYEWMQHACTLVQAGHTPAETRALLDSYLIERKGTGSMGTRSANTRGFVLANLMACWVTPLPQLTSVHDIALQLIESASETDAIAVHWGVACATYPFWYHIARNVGRLLSLQGLCTQRQLVTRLNEQYGQTATVSRYAQYVVRSFVAWGILQDTDTPGTLVSGTPIPIQNPAIVAFLFQSCLHAAQVTSKSYTALSNDASLFPFSLSYFAPAVLEKNNSFLTSLSSGNNEETMMLR